MHKEKLEEEKFLEEQEKNAKEIIIKEIKKENSRSSDVKEQGEADTP